MKLKGNVQRQIFQQPLLRSSKNDLCNCHVDPLLQYFVSDLEHIQGSKVRIAKLHVHFQHSVVKAIGSA